MTRQIMGIVNATPDSFYDGNPQNNLDALLDKCRRHVAEGAHILDIGGESTRPGATPISAEEELSRTSELIRCARKEFPHIILSQDTFKPAVALEGLKAGIDIINDVSGTQDPEMFKLVKDFNAHLVLTHSRGTPQTMLDPQHTAYTHLMAEIKDFLASKVAQAQNYGLRQDQLIIDPGFGFAKTREQNYHLLAHIAELKTLGVKLLIGLSHKKFLSQPNEKPPKRKTQTLCAHFAALAAGADILRVHDVKETKKVLTFFLELEANA